MQSDVWAQIRQRPLGNSKVVRFPKGTFCTQGARFGKPA